MQTEEVCPRLLDGLVAARIEELLIGRHLRFPVYNGDGVLLLAQGVVITPEVKSLLKARADGVVQIHPEDAATTMLDETVAANLPAFQLDRGVTEKLETVLSSGIFGVKNSGPAIKETFVGHRTEAYDQGRREEFIREHKAAAKSLDRLVEKTLLGGEADGEQVTQLAATFLNNMAEDSESLLSVAFESQDESLSQHSVLMAILGMAIGVEMGLDADNVRTIGITGLVCDWGMMRVPAEIRDAPKTLSWDEYLEIQKHPTYTLDMLQRLSSMPRLVPLIAYQIHEKCDGTGYPRGKDGSTIHPFAKILHVADTYTAITSPRPFRRRLMPYAAMEFLLRQARQEIVDRSTVRCLLNILSLFPVGSFVQLSDGSVACVLRRNGNQYRSPIVQVVRDKSGNRIAPDNTDAIFDPAEKRLDIIQALPTPGRKEIGFSAEIFDLPRPVV